MFVGILDDEPSIGDFLRQGLKLSGHDSGVFQFPAPFIDCVLRDLPRRYDALIVDLMLPGMSGADVVRAIRESKPDLPALIISGSDLGVLAEVARQLLNVPVLPKPFHLAELMAKLMQICEPDTEKLRIIG